MSELFFKKFDSLIIQCNFPTLFKLFDFKLMNNFFFVNLNVFQIAQQNYQILFRMGSMCVHEKKNNNKKLRKLIYAYL